MSKVITEPDFYKPMETYVPVKPDWSDLNETIEKVLANYKDYQYIICRNYRSYFTHFLLHLNQQKSYTNTYQHYDRKTSLLILF